MTSPDQPEYIHEEAQFLHEVHKFFFGRRCSPEFARKLRAFLKSCKSLPPEETQAIARGLRAVLMDVIADWDESYDPYLPRLVEIFQKAATVGDHRLTQEKSE